MASKLVGQFSGFEQDMAALEKQVKNAFRASRKILADDMRLCLQDHVEADVYDKFQPIEYVRRREDGGLADMSASATVYSDERDGGMNLTLLYQPSGALDGEGESVDPHVDGDDLVDRIEKRDPEYNWTRKPPKRPFFSNFVQEMIDGGRAEETLVRAMNGADPTLGMAADMGVIREEDDWR
uniref:Uncharacterized protein n=1 Tax=Siphoviridae sp. ctBeL15 TaxID=2825374 RepID=A0A8S5UZW5_9CAUD|nr:MAG TPA: hypothetical protein [Siphoviridae sp. ctBeL15]